MIGSHQRDTVLFNRDNIESINERWCTYIIQRGMDVDLAWRQAIEDEAELVEAKIELMEEGVMDWDWPSLQIKAAHLELDRANIQPPAPRQWQAIAGDEVKQ